MKVRSWILWTLFCCQPTTNYRRRYILAHPDQCVQMELYPQEHPSGRHTSIEWAEFDFNNSKDRPFLHANVNEVVLQAGDLMYLPTYWFHFIVSLNLNYQCNSRSGDSREYERFIDECGFTPATSIKRGRLLKWRAGWWRWRLGWKVLVNFLSIDGSRLFQPNSSLL